MTSDVRIAPATTDAEVAATIEIERLADELLIELFGASDWPAPPSVDERLSAPGFIFLAYEGRHPEPVGFAQALELDGHAHLEQLSVLPSRMRRGIGRKLVGAALAEAARRGYKLITLRTYADVPWNAPFYATCGFELSEPGSPLLCGLIDAEQRLGIDRYGRRVQMTAHLDR
ncbi:GNAT family N-acetyltransferase [Microbacterium sp. XT11]|uniref:GNAT family N-acetyltransferase n=1 Tax=Microbacterium sp. XT11 TaxID=367477 RepID=UPI000742E722|nr:GNAT family N-acetyltransferase [Microbacterium sp. XT11]ALX67151.1 hypothetical protein AB663_002877 [Microbacterium sp. XT11]